MAAPPRATYTFTCQHETKCAGDTTCHESSARLLRRRKASARLQCQWHMFSQCATSPGSLSSPRLVSLARLVLTNRVSCWCQPTAKPSPSTSCQLIDRLPRSPAQIPIRLHQLLEFRSIRRGIAPCPPRWLVAWPLWDAHVNATDNCTRSIGHNASWPPGTPLYPSSSLPKHLHLGKASNCLALPSI